MFLLDANAFIEAKNRYYAFDICPGFWEWLEGALGSEVASIENVRVELEDGNDPLAEWIVGLRSDQRFLLVDDEDTQVRFAEIAEHVERGNFRGPAKSKFLSGADPWLVAKACTTGCQIVTHEEPAPEAKKRVPLPDICDHFDVQYLNTFELLRQLNVKFGRV